MSTETTEDDERKLEEACRVGDVTVVRKILNSSCGGPRGDGLAVSALRVAVRCGSADVMRVILREYGVPPTRISLADLELYSSLVATSSSSQVDMVTTLASLGADPDQSDGRGNIPIRVAFCLGNLQAAEALLHIGCTPESSILVEAAGREGAREWFELMLQTGCGGIERVFRNWYLITQTQDADFLCVLLDVMVASGVSDLARHVDDQECTVLHVLVADFKCLPVVGHLLDLPQFQGHVDDKNWVGDAALHLAVRSGIVEMVRILLEHGADVEVQNCEGLTPLHTASLGGRSGTACVKLLLQFGAKASPRDKSGRTPLHLACSKEAMSCAELLLDFGAECDASDLSEFTPLSYVPWERGLSRSSLDLMELLLMRGANPRVHMKTSMKNVFCEPLVAMCWRCYPNADVGAICHVAQLLIDRGADVLCAETPRHARPLVIALFSNSPLSQVLLDNGASPDVVKREEDVLLDNLVMLANDRRHTETFVDSSERTFVSSVLSEPTNDTHTIQQVQDHQRRRFLRWIMA